jgi:hypothetical protein
METTQKKMVSVLSMHRLVLLLVIILCTAQYSSYLYNIHIVLSIVSNLEMIYSTQEGVCR